jgi:glycosyltransferase involved in cell wall biosynthesis
VPKISVVLPTYNQAAYLPACLDAIADQTCRDFELIVVDDGSTDDTARILADYQRQFAFQLISQENRGLPAALNAGFARAAGEYLTWTSSDNITLPEWLGRLAAELDRRADVGMVYSDWYDIDDAGRVMRAVRTLDYDPVVLLRHNYIRASFMYRRECRDQIGDYDPAMKYKEDHDYWLRIAGLWPMVRVPELLYQYRIHPASLSSARGDADREREEINRRFDAKHRTCRPLLWWYARQKWRWVKAMYMALGWEIPR